MAEACGVELRVILGNVGPKKIKRDALQRYAGFNPDRDLYSESLKDIVEMEVFMAA